MWWGTNIWPLLEEIMSWWFAGQVDISKWETVTMEEESVTQMVVEINIIKGKTLCYYNRTLMVAIRMVFHLSISSCPIKMVQLDLYNATTVLNGYIFQIIYLKFLLIVSMEEATCVVEVHPLAEIWHWTVTYMRWSCSKHWLNDYNFMEAQVILHWWQLSSFYLCQ